MIRRIHNYQLIAELKRGRQATVYRAYEEKRRRFVLLKVLQATDVETGERFTQEAAFLARLKHPNIVQVFQHGEEKLPSGKPCPFLALEFVEGLTLAEVMQAHKMPPELVIYLAREIVSALAAAHELGIVHRDIKPQNILIDTEGRVKVTDFGLAAAMGAPHNGSGSIVGTPQYMSPEQAGGEAVTPASDFFSLGVVMYEMLSGASPFDGASIAERLYRVKHEHPAPLVLSSHAPAQRLGQLVQRLLAKNSGHRPKEAAEVMRELEACTAELGCRAGAADLRRFISAPGEYEPPPALPVRPARRMAGGAWRSVSAAVLLLIILVAGWQITQHQSRPASDADQVAQQARDGAKTNTPQHQETAAPEITAAALPVPAVPAPERQGGEDRSRTPGQETSPAAIQTGLERTDAPALAASEEHQAQFPVQPGSVPAAPALAALRLSCLPVAYAVLNGDTLGQVDFTPVWFRVAEGEHTLTLHNPRFPTWTRPLRVTAGDTAAIAVSLWETVAMLRLYVQPWANVSVDGAALGKTPLPEIMLAPGEHTLELTHPERETFRTTRQFFAGRRDTLTIELRPR